MDKKDILIITISSVAFLFSVVSFLISLNKKKKENYIELRKSLSETLNELAKINVEFSKLIIDSKNSMANDIIELRRNLNTARAGLISHADFLISENPKIATEIDYTLMAFANNAISNYPKADHYYNLSIETSKDNVVKHMNLRGYAGFLFFQDHKDLGRSTYDKSLQLKLPNNDNIKRIITDTCLMWAKVEWSFGFMDDSNRLITKATIYCNEIAHKGIRSEIGQQIENFKAVIKSDTNLEPKIDLISSPHITAIPLGSSITFTPPH